MTRHSLIKTTYLFLTFYYSFWFLISNWYIDLIECKSGFVHIEMKIRMKIAVKINIKCEITSFTSGYCLFRSDKYSRKKANYFTFICSSKFNQVIESCEKPALNYDCKLQLFISMCYCALQKQRNNQKDGKRYAFYVLSIERTNPMESTLDCG